MPQVLRVETVLRRPFQRFSRAGDEEVGRIGGLAEGFGEVAYCSFEEGGGLVVTAPLGTTLRSAIFGRPRGAGWWWGGRMSVVDGTASKGAGEVCDWKVEMRVWIAVISAMQRAEI